MIIIKNAMFSDNENNILSKVQNQPFCKSSAVKEQETMKGIKQLPANFDGTGEVRGFKFSRICVTYRGFCYEVTGSGINPHFEVFSRLKNKRFNCESYPTSKAFGIWAWTYRNQDEALNKLNSL